MHAKDEQIAVETELETPAPAARIRLLGARSLRRSAALLQALYGPHGRPPSIR